MKKRILKLLGAIVLAFLIIYLILPPPAELPPLPNSLKSDEPGDIVQITGISAYYTDMSRQDVISFYQKNYSLSGFLGIPLFGYKLNHPPEIAKNIIRYTQQSSYVEEMVHPLRESLYVSGYEWENDPFTKPEKRAKNKSIKNGYEHKAKITLAQRRSNPAIRLIVFAGVLGLGWWLSKEITGVVKGCLNLINFRKK